MSAAATSQNVSLLSRCDQGGRPDGVQVTVHKGYAYIGHMFADGFSVVDVHEPAKPKTVAFIAAPKNTRSQHLQIHGDILLIVNGPNIWAMQQYVSQADYYVKSLADTLNIDKPFGAGIQPKQVVISCRLRRKKSSISALTRSRSFSPATCLSIPTASCT